MDEMREALRDLDFPTTAAEVKRTLQDKFQDVKEALDLDKLDDNKVYSSKEDVYADLGIEEDRGGIF